MGVTLPGVAARGGRAPGCVSRCGSCNRRHGYAVAFEISPSKRLLASRLDAVFSHVMSCVRSWPLRFGISVVLLVEVVAYVVIPILCLPPLPALSAFSAGNVS